MSKKTYYTQSSLEKATGELKALQTIERKAIAAKIERARAHGDLSENADYTAAKEAQGFLEMRIAELEDKIAHARVIDEHAIDTSCVSILTTVKVKLHPVGRVVSYKIVPPAEADVKQNKLSMDSPVAKGLFKRKVGEIVTIEVPAGKRRFEILEIGL